MQRMTVDELKRLLYEAFCEHLSMKDIENIIMTEEASHVENPDECPVDIDSKFNIIRLLQNLFQESQEQ